MKIRTYNYNFPVRASYKGWSITLHDITPSFTFKLHCEATFSINPEEYALIITQHVRSELGHCPENLYDKVKHNAENFAKRINVPRPLVVKVDNSALIAGNCGAVNRALSVVEQHIDKSLGDIWGKFCNQLDINFLLLTSSF